jgi:hypothetical protein
VGGQRLTAAPFVMVVRYLEFDVNWDLTRLETDLQSMGLLHRTPLGKAWISTVQMQEVFELCMKELRKDPYYLLKRPPRFIPGRIPCDGPSILQEEGQPQGYYEIVE